MEIRLSGHGSYHHEFHIVWIPKYRKKILRGELRSFLEKHLYDIQDYHPDVEIEKYSIQIDHVHLIIIIPPRYSVSGVTGKIKANTSREIRKKFKWVRRYIDVMNSGLLVFSPPEWELMKRLLKDT